MAEQYQLVEEVVDEVVDAALDNKQNLTELFMEALNKRELFIGSVPPISHLHEADLDIVARVGRAVQLWDGVELDTTMIRALILLLEQQGIELIINPDGEGEEEEEGEEEGGSHDGDD